MIAESERNVTYLYAITLLKALTASHGFTVDESAISTVEIFDEILSADLQKGGVMPADRADVHPDVAIRVATHDHPGRI